MRSFVPLFSLLVGAVVLTATGVASAGNANKTGQACFKGMYPNYQDPSTRQPFATEEACTSFAAKGGTLVPEVDISLAFNEGSTTSGTFAVHNAGPVSVAVTIEVNLQWATTGTGGLVVAESAQCSPFVLDSAGDVVRAICNATVGAGNTVNFLSVDTSAASAVQGVGAVTNVNPNYPDPNTINNAVNWNLSSGL